MRRLRDEDGKSERERERERGREIGRTDGWGARGWETGDDSGSRGSVAAVGGMEGWNGENVRPGSGGWCRGGWADTQGAHARVCAGNCELYVDPLTVIKNCPAGYHPRRNGALRTSVRGRGEETTRTGCAPPRIIPSRFVRGHVTSRASEQQSRRRHRRFAIRFLDTRNSRSWYTYIYM